ncbi:MAG: Translation initiation factor IF-2 [Candidatus Hodgkinia cicadicola]|nr:MAG: Translation initiation factor IF-2 [Candidatus Hodgkinia cicadicola]
MMFACAQALAIGNIALGAQALLDVVDNVPKMPVVTVLGHIDHGKTSLLDAITSKQIARTEVGNITQCLRVHSLKYKGHKISFLDTPGHSLFEAIRLNSVSVTDAAVLIISAAEGVKQQTYECARHVLRRNVPTLLVYTKLDRGLSEIASVRASLLSAGLIPEAVGGLTPEVSVSSKSGEHVKLVLDTLCALLEVCCPQCDIGATTAGTILDVSVRAGQAAVASALVERGVLLSGQVVAIGEHEAKVKLVGSDHIANASMFVMLTGLPNGVAAGQTFRAWRAGVDFEDERARQSAADNAIIKADSRNSINSVIRLLAERNVGVICSGLGEVTESNVLLARFTGAWVVAFNVKVNAQQDKLAQQLGVSVIKSALIYELADAIDALLAPTYVSTRWHVTKLFSARDGRTIYGAKANQGCVRLNQCASVYRQNKLVFVSSVTIRTLKRFNRPVDTVRCGQEFGFTLNEQRRIKVGDVLKTF